MGAEENTPFDLMEFVQTIFDKIKIPNKQELYIWGANAVIRVDLIPYEGKVDVRFDGIDMGHFESYLPDDATQGNLCMFHQQYRKGMKKSGPTSKEIIMMNIVKPNQYIRVFEA